MVKIFSEVLNKEGVIIGYIFQLWKNSKDIEFVRQVIGHRRLDSTSSYVSQMTVEERENRISSI